jgi:ABC-2 type transport system permease protein
MTDLKINAAGFLLALRHNGRLAGYLMLANIRAACPSTRRFVTEAVMMLLNNLLYLLIWVFYFAQFQQLNGYRLADMAVIYAASCISFGLMALLADGVRSLSRYITTGELDRFVTMPCHPLLTVVFSRSNASGLGDIASGLLVWLTLAHGSVLDVPLLMLIALLCAIIGACLLLSVHALAFWGAASDRAAEEVYISFLIIGNYPTNIYSPIVKAFLFTVFPAGLIAAMPLAILQQHHGWALPVLLLASGIWLALASWIFRRGMRRYVSGNQIFAA